MKPGFARDLGAMSLSFMSTKVPRPAGSLQAVRLLVAADDRVDRQPVVLALDRGDLSLDQALGLR
jgi:hypothetical protein